MLSFVNLKYVVHEGVARITLNRPEKRNALSQDLLTEFDSALDLVEADQAVRAVVIQGEGPSFCSGYDLTPRAGYESAQQDSQPGRAPDILPGRTAELPNIRRWFRMQDIPKPIIAKVHGYAVAGGCELAMMCDLVVAADDCQIGYPIMRGTGTPPTLIFAWLAGIRKSKELLFTGQLVDGPTAVRIGLANTSVPACGLDAEVKRITDAIRTVPQDLMTLTKSAINQQFDIMGLRSGLQSGFEMHIIGHHVASVQEFLHIRDTKGLRAALEWRDGNASF
jgi:enoyl-CoA hydratase